MLKISPVIFTSTNILPSPEAIVDQVRAAAIEAGQAKSKSLHLRGVPLVQRADALHEVGRVQVGVVDYGDTLAEA